MRAPKRPDWIAIQADYVHGGMTPAAIAGKYGVTVAAVSKQVTRGGWVAKRAANEEALAQKATAALRERVDRESTRAEAERLDRLLTIGTKLALKIDAAVEELGEYYEVKCKTTHLEAPLVEGQRPNTVEETSTETRRGKSAIKPGDVRALTSALRELRDITRVAAGDAHADAGVTIRFADPEIEEASK